jgi:hypothetical protein
MTKEAGETRPPGLLLATHSPAPAFGLRADGSGFFILTQTARRRTMLLSLRTLALGLIVVAGLGLQNAAQAERVIPATGSVEGQIIFQVLPTPEQPVGIQVYDATGTGTFIGKHVNRGVTFFTADGDVFGVFQVTAADGSTVSGSYVGSFAPIPGTPDVEFVVEVTWESGTGRLEGVSGGCDVVAVVEGLTGVLTYDYEGLWILP